MAYKIVGRYLSVEERPKWASFGKTGCQHKKRVYVSYEDFKRYAPETLKRWSAYLSVSAFRLVDGKWEELSVTIKD